jgi:hypothetical protein
MAPRRGVCRTSRRLAALPPAEGTDRHRAHPAYRDLGAAHRPESQSDRFGCAPAVARPLRAHDVRPNSLPANLSRGVCTEKEIPRASDSGEAGQGRRAPRTGRFGRAYAGRTPRRDDRGAAPDKGSSGSISRPARACGGAVRLIACIEDAEVIAERGGSRLVGRHSRRTLNHARASHCHKPVTIPGDIPNAET